MKYLFILGRNLELSIAEVKSFLKRTGNEILGEERRENGLLLELKNPVDTGAVDELGGVIAIGIVICRIKDIEKKQIYLGTSSKLNYILWDFSDFTEGVSNYLKKRFRAEEIKAVEKKVSGFMKSQDEAVLRKPSSNLIDEEYFVFNDMFGKITQKCNYREIEKRDMQKPVRREELSISPRLAKIMINLSEIKENGILLDCFCGIGVVLIESLNMGIRAIGIDKDNNAINGAKKNLEWFKFPSGSYRLFNDDSSKIKISPVDVLVSEPDFGKILKQAPERKEAEKMIKQFEELMINVLNNLKMNVSGKIVFSAPSINAGEERIGCDFFKLCKKTGLKLKEGFPISDFREGQIVGREIIVLEKN